MNPPFRIVASSSAAARLDAVVTFLDDFPPDHPITVVGASRGAADDLIRRVARRRGATFGLSRFSLTQLAARLAARALAGHGIAPATMLGTEAVAARVVFDASREGRLGYFGGVAGTPGFPRALAHTLSDVRLAGIAATALDAVRQVGPDLSLLVARAEQAFDTAATADRARLLAAAAAGLDNDAVVDAPLVLLDLGVESLAEERFLAALTARAPTVLATIPAQDSFAREALERIGGRLHEIAEVGESDLRHVRRYLFSDAAPPARRADGSLELFSAPGEGRESIEIARRILVEARRGVPFDEMAILVRSPQQYHGLLEHALERARVPAWFDRGTRRPHAGGRAFLALLSCVCEGLSARRFAEYLSLGQLPDPARIIRDWVPSGDEVFNRTEDDERDDSPPEADREADAGAGEGARGGTLTAPRRWEQLLVDAAVIGGGPERWTRRLGGLAEELDSRLDAARRDDPDSPRVAALERERQHLDHLRAFALPLVTRLAEWPARASWGEWLDCLERLAPTVLRDPTLVMRVVADLRPMATIGPVSIDEVRGVLAERLRLEDAEPPARRYGRVFVATPEQARGRTFRVVFVPGLAERMFPRKPVQDPLLLDVARERLNGHLRTRAAAGHRERLLLHLAVGAATERLYVSYPRLDVAEGRLRVPSFYALDLVRGVTGRIPNHEALAELAAQAGDATLSWPAPTDPTLAIDDQEHDLAVLRQLLDASDSSTVRGHAQYLLRLNAALRRSVTERWARGERKWSQFDGLIRVTPATRAALHQHRLTERTYSLSALQRFAVCPYQFFLSAVYRLSVADHPEPLQRLDPLTKGSIVHKMQAEIFRELAAADALPVTPSTLDAAQQVVVRVVARVADEYQEKLAPAVTRVWEEEMAVIARDLRRWLARVAEEGDAWLPQRFELSFGLPHHPERDPHSVSTPARIDGRFSLRGAVDLVERHLTSGQLRVTDYKTGRDRSTDPLVIGGGTMLQPVLYSLAVEQVTGDTVESSRLFFCTAAGGYTIRPIALTPESRRAGIEALEIIDRAIELGSLAPAPSEGACVWCDFRTVCGPNEEQRVARKPGERLRDLLELRRRP